MLVIPAIDLMGGQVVRLKKGDFATQTVYSADPAEVSVSGISSGAFMANQLHIAHSAGIVGADHVMEVIGRGSITL